jgi:hypothetical protein
METWSRLVLDALLEPGDDEEDRQAEEAESR